MSVTKAVLSLAVLGLGVTLWSVVAMADTVVENESSAPIPVILDTDIGDDIDDTWALAMILGSPELDLKLVVTGTGNTEAKAQLTAKYLERAGRTDVPVGIGVKTGDKKPRQHEWAKDYDLDSYPGTVHKDGIAAMIDLIRSSAGETVLLAIGPLTNVAEALRREPAIAEKARFVSMAGSVNFKYGGVPGRAPEYNVVRDTAASKTVFSAPWDITITPLDTCGIIVLKGDRYAAVRDSKKPAAVALIENYRVWSRRDARKKNKPIVASSTLFDTVAVYLVFDTSFCEMKDIAITINDKGETVPDPNGKTMHVALNWKDRDAFETLLANRIAE